MNAEAVHHRRSVKKELVPKFRRLERKVDRAIAAALLEASVKPARTRKRAASVRSPDAARIDERSEMIRKNARTPKKEQQRHRPGRREKTPDSGSEDSTENDGKVPQQRMPVKPRSPSHIRTPSTMKVTEGLRNEALKEEIRKEEKTAASIRSPDVATRFDERSQKKNKDSPENAED